MNVPTNGYLLMIETSQRQGSVALGTLDGTVHDEEHFSPGLVHGKELLPRINTIIERNQAKDQLAVVAASKGPGSFTGIRIGVSAAKAIAWSLKIPALGISSLEVLAANIEEEGKWGVLLDGSSGDLDLAFFEVSAGKATRISEELAIHCKDLSSFIEPGMKFIGSGARTADFPTDLETGPEQWDTPQAIHGLKIGKIHVREILAGQQPPPGWELSHQLNPRYLRASRAEEVRLRRIANEEKK
ncbi:MAG: tRNA (adenosine(37)-N6)-threonylcarbamoyltransferase complex dimerization subunit type 1 TsaB [Planctomycetota bacterium]